MNNYKNFDLTSIPRKILNMDGVEPRLKLALSFNMIAWSRHADKTFNLRLRWSRCFNQLPGVLFAIKFQIFQPLWEVVRIVSVCHTTRHRKIPTWVRASFCCMAKRRSWLRVCFSVSAAANCRCISSSCTTYSSHRDANIARSDAKVAASSCVERTVLVKIKKT